MLIMVFMSCYIFAVLVFHIRYCGEVPVVTTVCGVSELRRVFTWPVEDLRYSGLGPWWTWGIWVISAAMVIVMLAI